MADEPIQRERRYAMIAIDLTVFAAVLKLPAHVTVRDIRLDFRMDTPFLIVESEQFPLVPLACELPMLTPVYVRNTETGEVRLKEIRGFDGPLDP